VHEKGEHRAAKAPIARRASPDHSLALRPPKARAPGHENRETRQHGRGNADGSAQKIEISHVAWLMTPTSESPSHVPGSNLQSGSFTAPTSQKAP